MKVDIEEIRIKAEQYYREGQFYCSEAVVKAVLEGFGETLTPQIVAMASGFPVGIGAAGCTCGALSGGVMTLGYFFGRSEGADPAVTRCMELSKELHSRFVKRNRCTCCRTLTRNMQKGTPEHMAQCIRFTGEVVADCVEIINNNTKS